MCWPMKRRRRHDESELPDGKRIAIMLAFDIDAELMWMLRNDENDKHPANISRGHYSVRQGVPRHPEAAGGGGHQGHLLHPRLGGGAESGPDPGHS